MSVLRQVESIRVTNCLSKIGKECLGISTVTFDKTKSTVTLGFSGSEKEVLDAMIAVGENSIIIARGQDTVYVQYKTPTYIKRVEGLTPIKAVTLSLISVYVGDISDVL